jgi:hypothetical protein
MNLVERIRQDRINYAQKITPRLYFVIKHTGAQIN